MTALNVIKIAIIINCLKITLCHEKIIIVGCGVSGIAAASKLYRNGFKNITMLEAESRIGGRIATVSLCGTKVDLGAGWFYQQTGNAVYEKLKELDLMKLARREDVDPKQFYVSSRKIISPEFSDELMEAFSEAKKKLNGSKESLGIALKRRYTEQILKKYSKNPEKLRIARLAENYFVHYEKRKTGSFSLYDVAAFDPELFPRSGPTFGWKNGYSTFLDVLLEKYPDPKNQLPIEIRLNKEVTKITYDEKNTGSTSIKVKCSDGSTYTSKHVIFTASLGVLKAKGNSLFEPKLSESKMKAIKNIGYGSSLKVFVSFDTKWWGNSSGFNLLWSEADKALARKKFPYGPKTQEGQSWIVEHFFVYPVPDSNVLLLFFSGETLRRIELMDKNELKNGIYYTFKLFLGHIYNISKPQKLVRSNWYSNSNFYGINSFTTLYSSGEDRRNLLSPITNSIRQPILQFAGEATNSLNYGTVQGAVDSGYREAERLIELYKK